MQKLDAGTRLTGPRGSSNNRLNRSEMVPEVGQSLTNVSQGESLRSRGYFPFWTFGAQTLPTAYQTAPDGMDACPNKSDQVCRALNIVLLYQSRGLNFHRGRLQVFCLCWWFKRSCGHGAWGIRDLVDLLKAPSLIAPALTLQLVSEVRH